MKTNNSEDFEMTIAFCRPWILFVVHSLNGSFLFMYR